MARKVEAPQPEPVPDDGANDLSILQPDVTLTIAGREITVREYRFVEGLHIRARCKQLIADLHAQIKTGEMLTEDVLDVLSTHIDLVLSLIAESANVEREWLEGLNDADGDLLTLTWWGVCGPFFVRPIARRLGQALWLQQASAGPTSTPPSPSPVSDAPTNLVNTQNDS